MMAAGGSCYHSVTKASREVRGAAHETRIRPIAGAYQAARARGTSSASLLAIEFTEGRPRCALSINNALGQGAMSPSPVGVLVFSLLF